MYIKFSRTMWQRGQLAYDVMKKGAVDDIQVTFPPFLVEYDSNIFCIRKLHRHQKMLSSVHGSRAARNGTAAKLCSLVKDEQARHHF
jgi:hypothetical protein